jgi:hypothetical protein
MDKSRETSDGMPEAAVAEAWQQVGAIADDNGESAKIAVSDLAEIVGAEAIHDHRKIGGIKLIGQGDV